MVQVTIHALPRAPDWMKNIEARWKAITEQGLFESFNEKRLSGDFISRLMTIENVEVIEVDNSPRNKYIYTFSINTGNVRPESEIQRIEDRQERTKLLAELYGTQAGAEQATINRAQDVIDELFDHSYASGKQPNLLAATSLYVGSLLGMGRLTQAEIGEVADVSPSAISKQWKDVLKIIE